MPLTGRTRGAHLNRREERLLGDVAEPKDPILKDAGSSKKRVGARGFEPPTPRSRTECATRLRYAPKSAARGRATASARGGWALMEGRPHFVNAIVALWPLRRYCNPRTYAKSHHKLLPEPFTSSAWRVKPHCNRSRSSTLSGRNFAELQLPNGTSSMDVTAPDNALLPGPRRRRRTMPPELPAVRILIVDDDKAICDYMQTLLERDGFQVKTLSDPTVVEEEVRTRRLSPHHPRPDDAQARRHRGPAAHPQARQRHRGRHLHRASRTSRAPSPR